ncbi:hypothetical protein NL676_014200 [Syzygium grande]|nr:hypothetical protein NL676_014200 [Syzygium grande]
MAAESRALMDSIGLAGMRSGSLGYVLEVDWSGSAMMRSQGIASTGYQEKFYFNPGDTSFKVFETKFAKIGV